MKKTILMMVLLCTTTLFAQQSEYNKNITLSKISQNDTWYVNEGGEFYSTEQSPVGLFKISSMASSIDDYEMLSLTLKTKRSYIKKGWFNGNVMVIWLSNEGINMINISKHK
jgi:hypothetical protein